MEEYIFKKSRSINDTLKSLYSHLCRDIAPAVFGVILLHVAYFENFEDNRPDVAIWYLIAGIVVVIYALFRFWKLYKVFTTTRIKSFILDEKGVHFIFSKYPYKADAVWEDIELIEYFPGDVDEGLTSKVEYLEYTDLYGQFEDHEGLKFKQVVRIMNRDWKNEQGEELFNIILKLEGSKDKLKIV